MVQSTNKTINYIKLKSSKVRSFIGNQKQHISQLIKYGKQEYQIVPWSAPELQNIL